MNESGLLSTVANLCNLPKKEIDFGYPNAAAIQPSDSDPKTAEENLCNWIKESSGKILKDVIPVRFWSEHNLSKPSEVSELCPSELNDSVVVLLVVLWSWCSQKCFQEITVCLKYGAKNWQTDDMFKPIDWLRTYVKSIWICVVHSSREIRSQANEEEDGPEIAGQTILIDAYGLSQAVSNSSEWFGILTSKQVPTVIFRVFMDHYVSKSKLKAKFMGSVSNLSVFSEDNRKVVMYWSIAAWFKTTIILPPLVELMTLGPMAELANEIKTLRRTNDEYTPCMRMETYRKASEKAALEIGLDMSGKENTVVRMLAVFARLAQQLIEKKTKHVIFHNENMVLKILCPFLLDAAIEGKRAIVLLKELMTKKPPLFRDEFVEAMYHFIPTDNANENIPKNLSTKKASMKKASTKKTPEKYSADGTLYDKVRKGTRTREKPKVMKGTEKGKDPKLQVSKRDKSKRDKIDKKRKNTSTQDERKVRVKVDKEEKKVTQTHLDNKTGGDKDIQPKTGRSSSKTTAVELLPWIKRMQSTLNYFNEHGEMKEYKDIWNRCQNISETHSQDFSQLKTRSITQDLVVVYLALISAVKMCRRYPMGQMPKDLKQLENRTFAEIKTALARCHVKIHLKGKTLCHLMDSFKLLRSKTYVNVSINKAYGTECDNHQNADDIHKFIEMDLKKKDLKKKR